jgi:hypothetical protein
MRAHVFERVHVVTVVSQSHIFKSPHVFKVQNSNEHELSERNTFGNVQRGSR